MVSSSSGVPPVAPAFHADAHPIAMHDADHLWWRQEHGFFLPFDPYEAESRAIGAHDAFGDPWKRGCRGVPRRARRALPVFMHGRAPRAPLAVVSFHRTRFYAPPDRAGQTSQALRSWFSPIDRLATMPPRCRHRWGWHMNKVSKISRVAYMVGRRNAGRMRRRCRSHAVRGRRLPGPGAQRGHRRTRTQRAQFQRPRLIGGHRKRRLGAVQRRRLWRQVRDARTRPVCIAAGGRTR